MFYENNSLERWVPLTAGATRGLSDSQIKTIAERCLVKSWMQRSGANTFAAVWHEMSFVINKPCVCSRCND